MFLLFFFFNDTATTEIYTLSLHDALPTSLLSSAIGAPPSSSGPPRGPQGNHSGCRRTPPHTLESSSREHPPHLLRGGQAGQRPDQVPVCLAAPRQAPDRRRRDAEVRVERPAPQPAARLGDVHEGHPASLANHPGQLREGP